MKKIFDIIFLICLLFSDIILYSQNSIFKQDNARIEYYIIDPQKSDLRLYWKDDKGKIINTFNNLKTYVESEKMNLIFAMNGGMYKKDFSPQGLYIQEGIQLSPSDTLKQGYGNFYMQPNGVFYISNSNKGVVCTTEDLPHIQNIRFATQSGPMLIIDGKIHPRFIHGSKNLNIRNGVGILPDNRIIFAISKEEINFYDFASFFKNKGCLNALYLDGFVSRIYLPGENINQSDGIFGVLIGVTEIAKGN